MQLPPKNYDAMVKRANPPSPVVKDCLWAFFVGGAICLLGEALRQFYLSWYDKDLAGTLTSITLVMLSAITTVPGWYQKLAAKAGAGTLVPITGFANSVVSPAVEFKAEGWITGVGAKIFTIAGPVLAFGTLASWVWGLVYWAMISFDPKIIAQGAALAALRIFFAPLRHTKPKQTGKGIACYADTKGRYCNIPAPAGAGGLGRRGRKKRERRPAGTGL